MSTLRNDLEQADSPLTTFIPGVPWPHVDPDSYGADVRKDWVRIGQSDRTSCSAIVNVTHCVLASFSLYDRLRTRIVP